MYHTRQGAINGALRIVKTAFIVFEYDGVDRTRYEWCGVESSLAWYVQGTAENAKFAKGYPNPRETMYYHEDGAPRDGTPNISTNTTRKVAAIRKAVEEALVARERALQTALEKAQRKAKAEGRGEFTQKYLRVLADANDAKAQIKETKATAAIVFTTFDNVARK